MKVIIIEDEPASQQALSELIRMHHRKPEIVAIADNVPEAVAAIGTLAPDIVFLDIEIRMGTGFDVLARIGQRSFEVIFTTTFNTFAIEAFRHHALDYLLKPLNEALVGEAIDRCYSKIINHNRDEDNISKLLQQLQLSATQKTKLAIHTIDGIVFVDIADIIYVEAQSNYTDLWLSSGARITSSRKLKEMEDSLPLNFFFRIHHSYLVNLRYVSKYHKGRGGYVVLQNGASLPVSSARKDNFLKWLS